MNIVALYASEPCVPVYHFGEHGHRVSMTPSLQAVYLAVISHIDNFGTSPSLAKLNEMVGLTPPSNARTSTRDRLIELEERGWIKIIRDPATGHAVEDGIRLLEPVMRHLTPYDKIKGEEK